MKDKIINIDPDILGGTPVFNGSRVPVKNLFDYLETGKSIDAFVSDFDTVSRDQVVRLLSLTNKLLLTNIRILDENFAG
jgi:uncharacterized protein (DUF433 family)